MRGREPVTDEIDHLPRREAVRPHDRLGAAVAAGRKQFERAVTGWRMSAALGTDGFASHRGRIAEDNRYCSVRLAADLCTRSIDRPSYVLDRYSRLADRHVRELRKGLQQ